MNNWMYTLKFLGLPIKGPDLGTHLQDETFKENATLIDVVWNSLRKCKKNWEY